MNKISITERRTSGGDWTATIQGAIDQMFQLGGGEVLLPAGDYEVGTIRLRSGVTLHLLENAHLIASRDPQVYAYVAENDIEPVAEEDCTDAIWEPMHIRKSYDFMMKPMSRWNRGVIRAVDAKNIAIIGEAGSWIDGGDCYDELGEERYRGPHAINMHRCENLLFKGYQIRNSANWAHALFCCNNIRAEDVSVIAGHDGIHITSCTNVVIENCDFQTGDDCVAGIDNLNVEVSHCKLNTACSGMRFGGTNVVAHDCLFYGPPNYRFRGALSLEDKKNCVPSVFGVTGGTMLSAYTYYADFSREIRGVPGNIVIYDCEFRRTDRFLHYNFSGNEPWQRNKPLDNVVFRNIKADAIRLPLTFWGDESQKGSLKLENVQVRFADGAERAFLHLGNYDKVTFRNVTVENLHGSCLIRKWTDDGTVQMDNCTCPGFDGNLEELTDEPFVCQAF